MISIGLPCGVELTFGAFLLLLPNFPFGLEYCSFDLCEFIFSAYFFVGDGEYPYSEPFLEFDLTRFLVLLLEFGDLIGDSLPVAFVVFLSGEPASSLSDPEYCIGK